MMAVISDIHANLPALQAVLSRIDALGCDRILCLGDVVGYLAQPGECIDLLRARGVASILGNHDHYIVSGEACTRSRLVAEITEFQRGRISPDQRDWLARSLSYVRQGADCFLHGGWQDPVDQYLYQITDEVFPPGCRRLFAGHTHVQALVRLGDRVFCNPGSVGQPRDGDPRAAFATIDGEAITLHRVAYDIDETARHMQAAGFAAKCWENLYQGAQIGGRIDRINAAAPHSP